MHRQKTDPDLMLYAPVVRLWPPFARARTGPDADGVAGELDTVGVAAGLAPAGGGRTLPTGCGAPGPAYSCGCSFACASRGVIHSSMGGTSARQVAMLWLPPGSMSRVTPGCRASRICWKACAACTSV